MRSRTETTGIIMEQQTSNIMTLRAMRIVAGRRSVIFAKVSGFNNTFEAIFGSFKIKKRDIFVPYARKIKQW